MPLSRFIGGTSITAAIQRIQKTPFLPIFDYAKESSKTEQECNEFANKIKLDVNEIPTNSAFALKYSSFNDYNKFSESVNYVLKHANPILLDAEMNKYHDHERDLYDILLRVYNQSHANIFKTYQMYRVDSMKELVEDIHSYKNLGVKLVRGAYYNQDKQHNILHSNKHDTDKNYNNAVKYVIHKMKSRPDLKLMLATHNKASVQLALSLNPNNTTVCFAQLLGMADDLGYDILSQKYKVYKYVPYGSFLETCPYLFRRLHENYGILRHI